MKTCFYSLLRTIALVSAALVLSSPTSDAFTPMHKRIETTIVSAPFLVHHDVSSALHLHPEQGRDLEAYANKHFRQLRGDHDDERTGQYQQTKTTALKHPSSSGVGEGVGAPHGPLAWCKKRVTGTWKRTTSASRFTVNKMP